MLVRSSDMSIAQLEKCEKVLQTTLGLLRRRSPDDVAVKDVSLDSGVALATIYKFFGNKDLLLAAALLEWSRPLMARSLDVSRTRAHEPAAQRLMRLIHDGTYAYVRAPSMLEIMISAGASRNPDVMAITTELRKLTGELLTAQLVDLDPGTTQVLTDLIQGAWFDLLVGLHSGRETIENGLRSIESEVFLACRGAGLDLR